MCEPRNRDNGASDVWALTAYTQKLPLQNHVLRVAKILLRGSPERLYVKVWPRYKY